MEMRIILIQSSLFTFDDWNAIDAAFDDRVNSFIYTRQNNPTVKLVEEKIAKIANGEKAKLFGSGMATISAALLHYLKPNDHVVAVKNIYGPLNNLLNVYLREKMNIDTTFVQGENVEDFKNAIKPNTKLIYFVSMSCLAARWLHLKHG